MFGMLKRKIEEQKLREIDRKQKVEEQELKLKLEREKREEEETKLLNIHIDNYLETIDMPFVMIPEVANSLLIILKARHTGGSVDIALTEELLEALMTFYNENFNFFITMLERKDIRVKGQESRLLNLILIKMDKNNYDKYYLKYGDFADGKSDIKKIVYEYFEVVEPDDVFDVGVLKFLAKYLQNKKVFQNEPSIWELTDSIKEFEVMYELDCKVMQMERRLNR